MLELSQQSGCTVYDCEFVHLARHLGVPVVTADAKVLRTFRDVAASPRDFIR